MYFTIDKESCEFFFRCISKCNVADNFYLSRCIWSTLCCFRKFHHIASITCIEIPNTQTSRYQSDIPVNVYQIVYHSSAR